MPEIYDNVNLQLGQALRETLAGSERLDACVGFFNFRGWKHVAEAVEGLSFRPRGAPAVRLLIGMVRAEQDVLKAVMQDEEPHRLTNQQADQIRQQILDGLREQLSYQIPSTRDEVTLRTLRSHLREGRVQVKMHLAYPLHAKLYLCHLQDRTATDCKGFLGSSNWTYAGLERQGELNVDVLDRDATRKLKAWFEARWGDRLALDANEYLIELLDESWAAERALEPYLIHLKLAYHLSREARNGLIEFDIPDSIRTRLLDFQAAAVRITAQRIMVQGGAMIADVVGLGKTMMATGVALTLQERYGFETLVIAPPNLVSMWEAYRDEYRWHGRVVRRTMARRELSHLRRFRLVIIDESHHLRTRTRQDYRAIRDYITANEPKVLLLTATPYNRAMEDVANQLGLFLSEDAVLPVRPEAALRRLGPTEFQNRYQLDSLNSLAAMRRSEEVEDWQRLLSHFVIRRTRSFVEENYAQVDEEGRTYLELGQRGERFYLPQRSPRQLRWEAVADDPAAALESDEVLDAIGSLALPRYQLHDFRTKSLIPTAEEKKILEGFATGSQGNLLGITRSMLYKRLSSSGYAFLLSLRRHLLLNHVMLRGLETQDVIPVGVYNPVMEEDGDGEDWDQDAVLNPENPDVEWTTAAASVLQQLKDRPVRGVTLLRAGLFGRDLQRQLRADNQILHAILDRAPIWNADRDSRLRSLHNLLQVMHGGDKVLVFTEFADTAQYLYRTLLAMNLEGGVGLITGTHVNASAGTAKDAVGVARRFSPRTSGVPGAPVPTEEELRVVIATDVLSEGLNLQDCSIVVNFDLPWAIIKLIQRAGRVDRIGQKAERVTLYSVCPTEGVEAVINLRGRIRQRLSTSAKVFGSDERFFGDPEEENQVRNLFDENAVLSTPEEEEVDYTSKAYEIWRQATERHPDLTRRAEKLPDQIHATRQSALAEKGILAYTLYGTVDRVHFRTPNGNVRGLTPLEALKRTECSPREEGASPQADHHAQVADIVEEATRQAVTRTAGSLSGVRKKVYERLKNLRDGRENTLFPMEPEHEAAIDALFDLPLTEEATQLISQAMHRGEQEEGLMSLVSLLHESGRLVIKKIAEDDNMRLVCSMGFV